MVLLKSDAFLTELTHMYQKSRTRGSVTITMKKYDGRTKPIPREGKPPLPEPKEHFCLIRAVHKSKKITTVVRQQDVSKFQVVFSSLLKSSFDGLKKLKKPKSKPKAT